VGVDDAICMSQYEIGGGGGGEGGAAARSVAHEIGSTTSCHLTSFGAVGAQQTNKDGWQVDDRKTSSTLHTQ
jgi:hypothetical protein